MHDHDVFADASSELEEFMRQRYRAKRLTSKRAAKWKLPFSKKCAGWIVKTRHHLNGQPLSLVLIPSEKFPYKVPAVYVRPEIPTLQYPHIEYEGKLCVWSEEVSFDPNDIRYVEELLRHADELLGDSITGKLDEDFDQGFLSYWMYAHNATVKVTSLCKMGSYRTRAVYVAYTGKGAVFADSPEELQDWLKNTGIKTKKRMISKSFIITMQPPWKPVDYPETLNDISEILCQKLGNEGDVHSLISEMLRTTAPLPTFLIQVSTADGIALVAMCCERNALSTGRPGRHNLGNGFRPGNYSPVHLYNRSKCLKLSGVTVNRQDIPWVLGRDHNPSLKKIQDVTLGVIGLGSVGSGLLPLLVKSGFSKFVLFDGDILESANIGRHWLGQPYVGQYKATACKKELQRQYPWVKVVYASDKNWFEDNSSIEYLDQCDLIISATGEWASDSLLGELSQQNQLCSSVVFCFTEAHAVATHCYVNVAESFSYGSLFNETGALVTPVASFDQETTRNLPSCGGLFQPYGGLELSSGQSMIAETVTALATGELDVNTTLHRVWVGSQRLLAANKGKWHEAWIQNNGDVGEGSRIVTAKVQPNNP